jgi:branched-chain amino acid transport system ATP-binding protein
VAEALLQVDNLSKRFGGVVASEAITFDVPVGELHAVIGPNGAGKTTLISQLAGELPPDAGSIRFGGAEITALPTYRRSQLGLARSFQITSLFPDFTALDNAALAVQAHCGHSFRFWRDARREAELREPARAALARVGLEARGDVLVSNLSHGEHRQLEIAMALATRPRMLLLDEPMAGMNSSERDDMVRFILEANCRRGITIVMIEHDMGMVMDISDTVCVLDFGKRIALGTPDHVSSDPHVIKAYLGEDDGNF